MPTYTFTKDQETYIVSEGNRTALACQTFIYTLRSEAATTQTSEGKTIGWLKVGLF